MFRYSSNQFERPTIILIVQQNYFQYEGRSQILFSNF